MTNFDPGGFVVLLTLLVGLAGGAVSVGVGHLAARLGPWTYERSVVAVLGVLLCAWVVAAAVVSSGMAILLAVVLAMGGAVLVTRDVRAASYGWVLGVVLLYLAFAVASATGLYRGVDRAGQPQGLISRNLPVFYAGGLLVCGALGGAVVSGARLGWRRLRRVRGGSRDRA